MQADAVSGGKVRVEWWTPCQKRKRKVQLGMQIQITHKRHGNGDRVTGLSTRANVVQQMPLFCIKEPKESKTKRWKLKATKVADHALEERGAGRQPKRQLRDIAKFTGIKNYDGL